MPRSRLTSISLEVDAAAAGIVAYEMSLVRSFPLPGFGSGVVYALAEHFANRGTGDGPGAGFSGEKSAVERHKGLERPLPAAGNLSFVDLCEKVHVVSC